jgi:quercetin dioxygenase-like cupin family protein
MPIIRKRDMTSGEGASPGHEILEVVDGKRGTQSLEIKEVTIAPNTRLPTHIHPNTEEAMVVLEGSLDAILGLERATIGPGDSVLAPAGATHGFVNRSDAPARVLFIFPAHGPETVQSRVKGTTSGFQSEAGLTGYASPQDRPLDNR